MSDPETKASMKEAAKEITKKYRSLKRNPDDVNAFRLTYRRLAYGGIWTMTYFSIPLFIMLNQTVFKKFCAFHSRMLNLKIRSAAGLFGLAFLMSSIYTTCGLPFYYKILKKIFGINSLSDIRSAIYDSIENRYMLNEDSAESKTNKQLLEEIDQKFTVLIDELAGVPKKMTDQYMDARKQVPRNKKE
ncbi:unnamed protein product [Blepharisma stoltei]|uniref:Uncharacterized protein n=1 Tax=Blepharisma stoltei TaxID=1481888 RepID=A0AAU9K4T8_9CILI|nr:unnamed protein product [Blepharisma stoltei]